MPHLISGVHDWINEIITVPIYYQTIPQPKGISLPKLPREEDPIELDSNHTS